MTPHQRLVDHLLEGRLDGQDKGHAANCPACAALLSAGEADVLPEGARAAWLQLAHAEARRPVWPWWLAPLALGLVNGLWAAAAVVVKVPWNWQTAGPRQPVLFVAAALLAALVTAGVLWALSPRRRLAAAVLGLAAFAAPLALFTAGHSFPTHPWTAGVHCLWTAVLLSALPLAGGIWCLTQVAFSPVRALAVGLVSAGVGLLVLQLHCEGSRLHVLFFHLLPWLALAVGTLLVRLVLPTRSYAP